MSTPTRDEQRKINNRGDFLDGVEFSLNLFAQIVKCNDWDIPRPWRTETFDQDVEAVFHEILGKTTNAQPATRDTSALPTDAVAYLTQEDVTKLHGAAHSGAMLGGDAAYEGCLKVEGILAEITLRSVPTPKATPAQYADQQQTERDYVRGWYDMMAKAGDIAAAMGHEDVELKIRAVERRAANIGGTAFCGHGVMAALCPECSPEAQAKKDAIYSAYLGISVLRTMCVAAKLTLAAARAKELLIELDTAFPGLAGRAALREIPKSRSQEEHGSSK